MVGRCMAAAGENRSPSLPGDTSGDKVQWPRLSVNTAKNTQQCHCTVQPSPPSLFGWHCIQLGWAGSWSWFHWDLSMFSISSKQLLVHKCLTTLQWWDVHNKGWHDSYCDGYICIWMYGCKFHITTSWFSFCTHPKVLSGCICRMNKTFLFLLSLTGTLKIAAR